MILTRAVRVRVSIANRQRKTRLPLLRIERESRRALAALGLDSSELSIVFASSALVRKLNHSYRGIDSTTDVLSFPIHEFGGRPLRYRRAAREASSGPGGVLLLGDVVIDPARANEQAREIGRPLGDEIMRLVVHGLMHLLGYDHEGSARERQRMRRAERSLASSLSLDFGL